MSGVYQAYKAVISLRVIIKPRRSNTFTSREYQEVYKIF